MSLIYSSFFSVSFCLRFFLFTIKIFLHLLLGMNNFSIKDSPWVLDGGVAERKMVQT